MFQKLNLIKGKSFDEQKIGRKTFYLSFMIYFLPNIFVNCVDPFLFDGVVPYRVSGILVLCLIVIMLAFPCLHGSEGICRGGFLFF